jgi:O-acetyl-ADP-ribose deacetylase (regulator of RNase III)
MCRLAAAVSFSFTTCRSCLDLANKRKLENLAFPAISTGVYGYPPAEAAEVRAQVALLVWVSCLPELL